MVLLSLSVQSAISSLLLSTTSRSERLSVLLVAIQENMAKSTTRAAWLVPQCVQLAQVLQSVKVVKVSMVKLTILKAHHAL